MLRALGRSTLGAGQMDICPHHVEPACTCACKPSLQTGADHEVQQKLNSLSTSKCQLLVTQTFELLPFSLQNLLQTGADREVQRILMELLNQMDGFDQTVNVKV